MGGIHPSNGTGEPTDSKPKLPIITYFPYSCFFFSPPWILSLLNLIIETVLQILNDFFRPCNNHCEKKIGNSNQCIKNGCLTWGAFDLDQPW